MDIPYPRKEFEITPTALVYGGDAMGRLPDGRAVFIPFVLPGERVLARVVEEKRGHIRAELVQLRDPSPMRIKPACIHFGVCGGCHYQHIPYLNQLEFKQRILKEQLERIAGITNPPVLPVVPSLSEYRYRNNLQFHLTPEGRLSYQAARRGGLMPVSECHLPDEALANIWPSLEFEPGTPLDRIGIRAGAGDEVLLTLEGTSTETPEFETSLPVSAVFLGADGHQVLMAGDDHLAIEVLDRFFRVSAGSFFQVNTQQAGNMVKYILDHLPLTGETKLLELYCGVGLFSAFLAPRVAHLAGIELSLPACQDFAANLDEFDNVTLYQGDAGDVMPHLTWKPDIVLADPPRAGLERSALDALLEISPALLAYISCDPSTLARDIQRLVAGGYHLVEAAPFDMFPQTYHIETIALLQNH